MSDDYYKESIIDVVRKLDEVYDILFDQVFNIAMSGELKQWSKGVEVGEVHQFNKEIFEGCSDINLNLLTTLMRHVENTYSSICILNNIDIKK